MVFAALFLVPVFIALLAFIILQKEITLKEFAAQVAVQAVVAGAAAGILYFQNVSDYEVWNGTVAKKASEHVSCEHSYSCNCRTVSCGKNCSTTVCDTCYEHRFDVDWAVYTSNDERLTIDRVDRQGLQEPARFDKVVKGEPTSLIHEFTNYIKGAPDTLFRHQGLLDKFKQYLPTYPQNVYDYYRLDRLVLVNGAKVEDSALWNAQLAALNGKIGRQKQCNVIAVFAKGLPDDYFYALEQFWIGGKQNDVAVVTGVDDNNKIQWVQVMAWTKNEMLRVAMRDDLLDLGSVDREKYLRVIEDDVQKFFIRKHMSEFQYLRASIKPTKTEWIVAMIISILVSIGLSIAFYEDSKNDY